MSINNLGLSILDNNKESLGIYIHIPFCVSKCKYCAFVSMVASEEDKKRYFVDLLNEIKLQAKIYSKSYKRKKLHL